MSTRRPAIHPLRQFRNERGYTQVETARLLEVNPVTVARWETGTRQVDAELILKISKLTGIHPARLRPDLARLFESE